jgi:hypothetical protein
MIDMGTRKIKPEVETLAGALSLLFQQNMIAPIDQSAPGLLSEVLDLLRPLSNLAAPRGEMPKQDAVMFKDIQDALRRADPGKAIRPDPAQCIYLSMTVIQEGRGR